MFSRPPSTATPSATGTRPPCRRASPSACATSPTKPWAPTPSAWPLSTAICSASSPAASARCAIIAPTGRSTSGIRPAPVDYKSDKDFWYNLTANFDVLDACWRQFLWTGDAAYVTDPAFLEFYRLTVGEYIEAWDKDGDGIPEHRPEYGYRGLGGYDEGPFSDRALYGSDLIAAMGRAFDSYGRIRQTLGNREDGDPFFERAEGLRKHYEEGWWSEEKGEVRRRPRSGRHASSTRTSSGTASSRSTSASSRPARGATRRSGASGRSARGDRDRIVPAGDPLSLRRRRGGLYPDPRPRGPARRSAANTPRSRSPWSGRSRPASWASGLMLRCARSRRAPVSPPRRRGPSCVTCPFSMASSTYVMKRGAARRSQPARAGAFVWRAVFEGVRDELTVDGVARKTECGVDEAGGAVSWVDVPMSAARKATVSAEK